MTAQRLVFFDLDGTITRHDTFIPYVVALLRERPGRLRRLPLLVPAALAFVLRLRDRGALKGAIMRALFAGLSRLEIEAFNLRFVERLAKQGMHRDALEAIATHRSAGDRLVLMSASPELYVPAIAARLGFSDTICTRVRWHGDRLHGELTTPNCRFREKAERLKEWRSRFPGIRTVAYANAASDLPHLEIADEGVLVNGRAPTRLLAEKLGIRCVDWQ